MKLAVALALPVLMAAAGAQAQAYASYPAYPQPTYESQAYQGQSYQGPSYQGQSYGYSSGYQGYSGYSGPAYAPSCGSRCGHERPRPRYDHSYNGQQDVPGDFRCDAYWDRGRTDCNAAWRDQRPWRRQTSHRPNRPAYGGPQVYYGEYGRPDVVYSQGPWQSGRPYPDRYGHDHGSYGQYGRDPQRINWCCAEYRSYDPATGYYTAYSGQRVYCG